MASVRMWQELTTKDFEALDRDRTVAVLAVGAIEQHGPHLPVWVDALVAEEVVRRAFAYLGDEVPALMLPPMPIGKSNEHIRFPGTLTLSAETLIRLWTEIGESVNRAGVAKLVFLNAHGGQPQVMEIVARELRVRHAMMAVTSSWWNLVDQTGLFEEAERLHGIHGGAVETSVMLALRPDLVRTDEAQDFRPVTAEIEGTFERLRYLGGVGIGWQAQDIHPEGVAGNATAADAKKGREVVEGAARGLARLIEEVSAYPLSAIVER